MWLLLAIGCMVLALKAMSVSLILGLIPAAAGYWCFSNSTNVSLETFMAFAFALVVIGAVLNAVVANW